MALRCGIGTGKSRPFCKVRLKKVIISMVLNRGKLSVVSEEKYGEENFSGR